MSTAAVTNVRAGQHYCFDRLVIDLKGKAKATTSATFPKWPRKGRASRSSSVAGHSCSSMINSPAYDNATGKATFTPANRSEVTNVSGYHTFRQVAWAGSFEGYTTLGLGIRARLPFKVYTLDGPDPAPGSSSTSRTTGEMAATGSRAANRLINYLDAAMPGSRRGNRGIAAVAGMYRCYSGTTSAGVSWRMVSPRK